MDIARLLLPPVFGAVIGLVTNALAIRMLFRPYREVRVLGLRFQGIIPRRKADIARTVSQVVTSELLREEQVAKRLAGPEVRGALREVALALAERYRGRLHGSLADLLGPARRLALERFLVHLLGDGTALAERWLGTPEGRDTVAGLVERWLDLTPADLLKGEEEAARGAVSAQVNRLLTDPGLEERLRPLATWALVRLAGSEHSVGELLPPQLAGALPRVLQGVVPELLRRFEAALLSPPNVARLKRAVRAGIRTYLADTEGGVVKNLIRQAAVLGQERILREADQVVDANLHRLRELVHEEGNRARLAEGVADAVGAVLRQTPAELMASLPPEVVDGAHAQLAAWLAGYLGRPEAGRFLASRVDTELDRLFRLPLRELAAAALPGELVAASPAQAAAEALCGWLGGGGLTLLVGREAAALARAAMHTPLGPELGLLAAPVVAEVADLALDQLLPVLTARVPEILTVVDVQGLIEREMLTFSPEDVERVILSVARRELRAITWWGAGL
ncbi:MAG TPA: DUF445 family protein, partial [Deferrisomatales bacterium]|nr:DUF445 family protein [Deferrisomatales bacterium]